MVCYGLNGNYFVIDDRNFLIQMKDGVLEETK